jgi:hypothetical protein
MLGEYLLPASCPDRVPPQSDSGSGESWLPSAAFGCEPRRGNSKVRDHFGGVGPFRFCARCYRFCYRFSTAPTDRRLTSFTGGSITFNIVASSAC